MLKHIDEGCEKDKLVNEVIEEKFKALNLENTNWNNKSRYTPEYEESNQNFEITKVNNQSPLRYPGGKTRACKKLDIIFLV